MKKNQTSSIKNQSATRLAFRLKKESPKGAPFKKSHRKGLC
jgi:hypothetical protein